ncbi:MAG: cytidylate kinase-like family protein [Planctomycetes bacterium]|nr:cytidylate kinase-like family protein [Planctomycetota bacterium]
MNRSSTNLSEAFLRAGQHWHARQHDDEVAASADVGPRAITVALSREAGAKGVSVARAIGERIGWPVYDRELLQRVAEESGLYENLLESVDEKRKGWMTACVEALLSVPSVSEHVYSRHLLRTMFSLAANGECVIVGRGAAQVLPRATTLCVRLIGALEDRIETMRPSLGGSREEAACWIARKDQERNAFVHSHFHKDPADPHEYDLVLNTSRLSVDESAECIIAAPRVFQARLSNKAVRVPGAR